MKVFKNGLLTGLILQLAIGPIFFYIINLTLQKTILDGLFAVLGATLSDYIYIVLTIFGIGELLKKEKTKKILGIISSIVLIIFGLFTIKNIINVNILNSVNTDSTTLLSSFFSTFFLTVSSPLSIVLFTGIFASKVIEFNYNKKELFIFGFSAGLGTFIFMSSFVVLSSLIKDNIPLLLIQIMNLVVGLLLVGYGTIRLAKILKINKFNSHSIIP